MEAEKELKENIHPSKVKKRVVDLTEGSIWKKLIIFAFPIMCSNLLQQLYNTVDSLVVGRFVGHTALAAVGATGSLTSLIIGFFMGMGTGSGVVISQYYGAKDHKNLEKKRPYRYGSCFDFWGCPWCDWSHYFPVSARTDEYSG